MSDRYKFMLAEDLSDEAREECLYIREKIGQMLDDYGLTFLYNND